MAKSRGISAVVAGRCLVRPSPAAALDEALPAFAAVRFSLMLPRFAFVCKIKQKRRRRSIYAGDAASHKSGA
jgi:hypothetical protein